MQKWQKNFRRIPNNINVKVGNLQTNDLTVSCSKSIPANDIRNGVYEHIGIRFDSVDELEIDQPEFVPAAENGRYSLKNAQGYEIIHAELPKVTRTFSWDVPNWGDSWNGTHEVSIDRQVYQRTWMPPKLVSLQIEMLNFNNQNNRYTFRFVLREVLNRTDSAFLDDLSFNLNLLQENVGAVDVYPSTATRADYIATLAVNWEILPPGNRDEIINTIIGRFRNPSPEIRTAIQERYDLLAGLKPINWINGTNGFINYFGAQFRDNLVVFENLKYGNAIYVMFDDWQNLSQLSRIDLLRDNKIGFRRIVHGKGWQATLIGYVRGMLQSGH
ncbi:MAG: hypothetical protein EHM58_01380 [Ignavibacteriae bacterium]|nr:MAG: hypothetical protein EHM58_01380 [Ignavibacteriota bacterium]